MATITTIPDERKRMAHMPSQAEIDRAKAYQQAERQRIEQATGLRISDAGVLAKPLHIVHCVREGCTYRSVARRSGQELRNLAAHLIAVHGSDWQGGAA